MTFNEHRCSCRDNGLASNKSCSKVLKQIQKRFSKKTGAQASVLKVLKRKNINLNDKLVTTMGDMCSFESMSLNVVWYMCVCIMVREQSPIFLRNDDNGISSMSFFPFVIFLEIFRAETCLGIASTFSY